MIEPGVLSQDAGHQEIAQRSGGQDHARAQADHAEQEQERRQVLERPERARACQESIESDWQRMEDVQEPLGPRHAAREERGAGEILPERHRQQDPADPAADGAERAWRGCSDRTLEEPLVRHPGLDRADEPDDDAPRAAEPGDIGPVPR